MKSFNLQAALGGKPVCLRSGTKAYIVADVRGYFKDCESYPLIVLPENGHLFRCTVDGRFFYRWKQTPNLTHENDIIGMWEGPRPMIKIGNFEFPKGETEPLEVGEEYYVPAMVSPELVEEYIWDGDITDMKFLESGLVHKKEEAAEQHVKVLIAISQGKTSLGEQDEI